MTFSLSRFTKTFQSQAMFILRKLPYRTLTNISPSHSDSKILALSRKKRATINFSAPVILNAGWYSPFYIGNATDVFSFYLLELCLKLLPLTENNENAVRGQPNMEWTAINQQKRFSDSKVWQISKAPESGGMCSDDLKDKNFILFSKF